ncbi:putative PEP-binding protein [Edaphobacter sp. 12200R-103]|nr:putative PEP-binding protein [Edaphobacter sp. 12200R-103]
MTAIQSGSNDLTQLTLGLDRDSSTVAHLFDETIWQCDA